MQGGIAAHGLTEELGKAAGGMFILCYFGGILGFPSAAIWFALK
jgi:hypothetical protein